MGDFEFQFFPDEYKEAIIQALSDAIRTNTKEFIEEFQLETNNAIDFLKWDFINSNVTRNTLDDRLIHIKIKRGRWALILLYDTEYKYLYALMRHKRFYQLQDQRRHRVAVHYIDALALLNKGLYSGNDQLNLFDEESWNEGVQSLLLSIVGEHRDEIKKFVLIGFTTFKDEVTTVSAIVPTIDLEIAHEVDWSEFIPTNYGTSNPVFDYTSFEDEEEEIPLKLKKLPEDEDVNIEVNLKKIDDNKEDEGC